MSLNRRQRILNRRSQVDSNQGRNNLVMNRARILNNCNLDRLLLRSIHVVNVKLLIAMTHPSREL